MGQAFVLLIQVVPFVSTGRQFAQFVDLPTQPVVFLLQAALSLLRLLPLFVCGGPVGMGLAHRLQRYLPIVIEQCAHGVGAGQALPSVLAMNVDELCAQLLELTQGCSTAVDPCAAAAFGVHGAPQQQHVVFKALILQPSVQGWRYIKFG